MFKSRLKIIFVCMFEIRDMHEFSYKFSFQHEGLFRHLCLLKWGLKWDFLRPCKMVRVWKSPQFLLHIFDKCIKNYYLFSLNVMFYSCAFFHSDLKWVLLCACKRAEVKKWEHLTIYFPTTLWLVPLWSDPVIAMPINMYAQFPR